MAGRLAPFIELGVGFNADLTARENVVLNGVMMGLSQREAARRLDSVLDFAELEEFVDMKLKNYSSGMMVRLAFSVMLEARADILLIDEVLAVGDASFQQKCADVFHEMRDEGRTIVLVTHDMGAVENYCDRAMLLEEGERVVLGDSNEVGRQYIRLNFHRHAKQGVTEGGSIPGRHASLVDGWIENSLGERITNVEIGEAIRFTAIVEAQEELVAPLFAIHIRSADGINIAEVHRQLDVERDENNRIPAGGRVRVSGTIENRLMPGHYYMTCWVARARQRGDQALQPLDVVDFVVFGMAGARGLVSMPAEASVVPLPASEAGDGSH
jgi:ABC-2 type transport system ATP-binding protein